MIIYSALFSFKINFFHTRDESFIALVYFSLVKKLVINKRQLFFFFHPMFNKYSNNQHTFDEKPTYNQIQQKYNK